MLISPVPVACAMLVVSLALFRCEQARRRYDSARRGLTEREHVYHEQIMGLFEAARRSPEAVVERLERAALSCAPGTEALLFVEADDDALVVRYARGMHAGFMSDMRIDPAGRSAVATAWRAGHRVATGTSGVERLCGEGAYLAVPLMVHGRAIAVVAFFAANPEDLDDHDMLVQLVERATPAYELARERRADIAAASIDGLTGLLCPVVFRQRLAEELRLAQRRRQPYALLFVDTDHFKSCNDTLGHAAGDVVLRAMAGMLLTFGGSRAIVGRNGGDEFCVALPVAKSAALRIAERLRAAVAEHPYAELLGAPLPVPITASIGVAAVPDDATDARGLLEAADAAMYTSKRAGRNRVSVVSVDTQTSVAQAVVASR